MQYVQIVVEGKVQGVYFRKYTQQVAHSLNLSGFVRNQRSGGVYIEACGPEEKIRQLIEWCNKGPSRAEVTKVSVAELPKRTYHNFEIKRTQ